MHEEARLYYTSSAEFSGRRRQFRLHSEAAEMTTCPRCKKENVRVYRDTGEMRLERHKVYVNGGKTGPWHYCIPGPRDADG